LSTVKASVEEGWSRRPGRRARSTALPARDLPWRSVGDIVLCKVNGNQYLHLVKAIQGARFQIGNNRGRINGWITAASIYGKCTKVE
jgi:hypothetical protein